MERIGAFRISNKRSEIWIKDIQGFPPRVFSWLQWMNSKEVNIRFTGPELTVFAVSVRTASTAWADIVKWTILDIQPPHKTADTTRVSHPMLIGSHRRNDINSGLCIVTHRGYESDRMNGGRISSLRGYEIKGFIRITHNPYCALRALAPQRPVTEILTIRCGPEYPNVLLF